MFDFHAKLESRLETFVFFRRCELTHLTLFMIISFKASPQPLDFHFGLSNFHSNLLHSLATFPSLVILYRKTPFTDLALAGSAATFSLIAAKIASELSATILPDGSGMLSFDLVDFTTLNKST